MFEVSRIQVSRSGLQKVLDSCGQRNWRVVTLQRPIGLVHYRGARFLDVVGNDGSIQGSLATGPDWNGASVWTNLHVLHRALTRRFDALVTLELGCDRFLVDGMPIEHADLLAGLGAVRDGRTREDRHESPETSRNGEAARAQLTPLSADRP